MKATINHKTYDTATATELASDGYPGSTSDFRNWDETLYVTAKGNHFLHGSGGPMSKYSESKGNQTSGGSAIIPMTKEEALDWCEEHDCQDAIEAHFSELVEDA